MNLNVAVALNSLSFGYVGYNILKELYNKGIQPCLFVIGEQVDLSSFDRCPQDFTLYLQSCIAKARGRYSRNNPCIRQWHIGGSEASQSNEQHLFTFHECSALSNVETNILNNQKSVIVSSNYSKKVFEDHGVNNCHFIPLGFDNENFRKLDKRAYPKDVISYSLYGKAEIRKGHNKVIGNWIKKYGNNRNYVLNLHLYNQFLNPEQNTQQLMAWMGGAKPFNVNIVGYTKTLTEYNQGVGACDIVLDGSLSEGWSNPSFSAVALGKHAVLHNATAIKDWATPENAVLVESDSMIPAKDNLFFQNQGDYNIGNWFNWSDDAWIAAMEKAEERYKNNPINIEGLKLQDKFKWTDTVDSILKIVNN